MKWLLSTPTRPTARRFLASLRGHDLNIKQMLCFVFLFFSRRSFRGDWTVAEWPWTLQKHRNMSQQLIGVLTLIFSAEEVYYPYSFAPIYSSFHRCFCSERCYFCAFGGGSVACGAITVAVAESYDLTPWQGIIASIIHSAVVTVKWTSWGHISQEERRKQRDGVNVVHG